MSAQLFTSGICCFAYQAQQGTKRRLAPVLTHGPQVDLYHPVQYRDEEEEPRAFGRALYPTEPEDHPPARTLELCAPHWPRGRSQTTTPRKRGLGNRNRPPVLVGYSHLLLLLFLGLCRARRVRGAAWRLAASSSSRWLQQPPLVFPAPGSVFL